MALPWLAIIDAAIGAAALVRRRKQGPAPFRQLDAQRLELEREQMEAERQRAERALMLELLRQQGDREIGRLRLLSGIALTSWLGTLIVAARLMGGSVGVRVMLGVGWLLLLSALAAALSGHSAVARALDRETPPTDGAAIAAQWLILSGLAIVALAVLIV
jgi:hypothetical protein